jgi:hypothetical protein
MLPALPRRSRPCEAEAGTPAVPGRRPGRGSGGRSGRTLGPWRKRPSRAVHAHRPDRVTPVGRRRLASLRLPGFATAERIIRSGRCPAVRFLVGRRHAGSARSRTSRMGGLSMSTIEGPVGPLGDFPTRAAALDACLRRASRDARRWEPVPNGQTWAIRLVRDRVHGRGRSLCESPNYRERAA